MPSTAILMRAGFILILMILWIQIAGAQTVYTINVKEDGSALWTVEIHKTFSTQSEINEWKNILEDPQNYSNKQESKEFIDKMNDSMRSAENNSNRSMRLENLNISYNMSKPLPNAYGIIRYSFEWTNFSQTNSSKIIIGDAFQDLMFSSDNVLIIKIPDGYDILNATPNFDKRDGNRLIWDGTMYRSFNKGEPSLVLSKVVVAQETWPDILPLLALVILVSGGIFILRIKKHPLIKRENEAVDPPKINESQTEPITGRMELSEKKESQTEILENHEPAITDITLKMSELTPDLTREILSDEEMIEQYLVKLGGQAYQSEIVKESGLSKSKISIVLAKMKEDGRILKIRKGKENIIRLVPKT